MLPPRLHRLVSGLDSDFFSRLHDWFGMNQRDLPWRENRNSGNPDRAYRVWISEIMLQQTQSETVKDYYLRWLRRFPSLKSLMSYRDRGKRENEILSLWQGLGYYRRGLQILRAAEVIKEKHGGQIPSERKSLLTLPGIGPYTAGAIMNFGFAAGEAPAMVDGNFRRVFSRLFHLSSAQAGQPALIWEIAEALCRHPANASPRVYNEAMMEVGALLCKVKQPLCIECPLQRSCVSYQMGKSDHNPFSAARKILPAHSTAIILPRGRKKEFLLMKKGDSPLNSLWRFPTVDRHPRKVIDFEHCRKLFLEKLGLRLGVSHPLFTLQHHYTRYRIALRVWEGSSMKGMEGKDGGIEWRWVPRSKLREVALSSSDQKIRDYILTATVFPRRMPE